MVVVVRMNFWLVVEVILFVRELDFVCVVSGGMSSNVVSRRRRECLLSLNFIGCFDWSSVVEIGVLFVGFCIGECC